MDAQQLDWLGYSEREWWLATHPDDPLDAPLPDVFFRGFDPPRSEDPPVYLDDSERYGEPEERVDPQTGYLEERWS